MGIRDFFILFNYLVSLYVCIGIDFFIFFVLGIIVEYFDYSFIVIFSLFCVVCVFRIGWLLCFYKGVCGICWFFFVLVIFLFVLFNIGVFFFFVMFIYVIIGMLLFGYVKKIGVFDELVNFEIFGSSMLLLFCFFIFVGWNDVLELLLIKFLDCDENYLG